MFDVDDAKGRPLAILIADFFARPNRHGGAWTASYSVQNSLLAQHPVVAIHLNITKPPTGQPVLLQLEEVEALFNVTGSALHSSLSDVKFPSLSSVNMSSDFGIYAARVNEMWVTWPDVLAQNARHYETGMPIPKEMIAKITEVKRFNQGFKTSEYLGAALLDQRWAQLSPTTIPDDVPAFEAASLKELGLDVGPIAPRYRSTYQIYSFGDLAATYYSYVWMELYSEDTAEWFRKNGGLLRSNGDWLRKSFLARGLSADPQELYRRFRKGDVSIEPLLVQRGLHDRPADGGQDRLH